MNNISFNWGDKSCCGKCNQCCDLNNARKLAESQSEQLPINLPLKNFTPQNYQCSDKNKGKKLNSTFGWTIGFREYKSTFKEVNLLINPVADALETDADLADLVGFKKDSTKLGKIAGAKTIREAVVAVPFVEKDGERKFFEIPLSLISLQSDAITRETLATSQVESIQQMIDSMGRYVIPPSFDFITYPN